jgi:hypothetical protein
LFLFHCARRLYECLAVHSFSPHAKVNLAQYLVGHAHYAVASLALACDALIQVSTAAAESARSSTHPSSSPASILHGPGAAEGVLGCQKQQLRQRWEQLQVCLEPGGASSSYDGGSSDSLFFSFFFCVAGGVTMFVIGTAIQHHSHGLLASYRGDGKLGAAMKKKDDDALANGGGGSGGSGGSGSAYQCPRGGCFELVSSPHYFGEVLIYLSFVILSGGSSGPTWCMLLWTTVNLTNTAMLTHRWYQKQFPDYPPQRKAIFPYCL